MHRETRYVLLFYSIPSLPSIRHPSFPSFFFPTSLFIHCWPLQAPLYSRLPQDGNDVQTSIVRHRLPGADTTAFASSALSTPPPSTQQLSDCRGPRVHNSSRFNIAHRSDAGFSRSSHSALSARRGCVAHRLLTILPSPSTTPSFCRTRCTSDITVAGNFFTSDFRRYAPRHPPPHPHRGHLFGGLRAFKEAVALAYGESWNKGERVSAGYRV